MAINPPRGQGRKLSLISISRPSLVAAVWAVAACLLLFAGDVRAGGLDQAWAGMAGLAPADTDMIFGVRGAGEVRRGEAGPALESFISRMLPMTAESGAWGALADGLELSTSDAFNAILGEEAAFMLRRRDAATEWALVSRADAKRAARLLSRLGAKPSSIKAGRPVAEIEGGRFRISARTSGDRATLVFAPASSESLFQDIVRRLDNPPEDSLSNHSGFDIARRALPGLGNAFVYIRSVRGDAEAGGADSWVGAEFRVEGMNIIAHAVSPIGQKQPASARLTNEQWRAISDGAILAVLEPIDLSPLPLAGLLGGAGLNITDLLLPIRGGVGLVLSRIDDRLGLGLIIETADTAALARGGDALIAGLASSVAPPGSDFRTLDGMFPATRRRLDAAFRDNPDPLARGIINSGLAAETLPLIWSYPANPSRDIPGATPGWLVLSTDEKLHSRIVGALSRPNAGRTEGAVAHFRAEPAPILDIARRAGLLSLEPGSPDEPPIFTALALLKDIAGESVVRDGLLIGRFVLRLSDGR